ARPPIAFAASLAAAGLRSITATRAPLAASASAVARPSPEPPPVTIAAAPEIFIAPCSKFFRVSPSPIATGGNSRQGGGPRQRRQAIFSKIRPPSTLTGKVTRLTQAGAPLASPVTKSKR